MNYIKFSYPSPARLSSLQKLQRAYVRVVIIYVRSVPVRSAPHYHLCNTKSQLLYNYGNNLANIAYNNIVKY